MFGLGTGFVLYVREHRRCAALACRMAGSKITLTLLVLASIIVVIFFFSSRRRHTRLQGDWSSDVCSSDLIPDVGVPDFRTITDAAERLVSDRDILLRLNQPGHDAEHDGRECDAARPSLFHSLAPLKSPNGWLARDASVSMWRALILDSSVWRGMPSFAAAPEGPEIRPRDSASAAMIKALSPSASVVIRRLVPIGAWLKGKPSHAPI